MKKIIIIGAGWYGLHLANILKKSYSIILLEKESDIFTGASYNNQNRLHLGYHYPRSFKTRKMCLTHHNRFINQYKNIIDVIDDNYYAISNYSYIDYKTYLQIFNTDKYNHTIVENNFLHEIEGDIINTQEKIINAEKAKQFFKKNICFDQRLNYKVENIKNIKNKVIVNNELTADLIFDTTNNMLNFSKKEYIFELTITFLYKRINYQIPFTALTIMDGPFFSLFPRNVSKRDYTLTHVQYTPITKNKHIKDIFNTSLNDSKIAEIRNNIEIDVIKVLPDFSREFEYDNYFTAYKCKLANYNDSRECIIENNERIISINCGKIIGIFDVEDYVKNQLKLIV